jgi:hypothetical protein
MNQKRRPEKGNCKESKKEREKNVLIASTISSRSATSSSKTKLFFLKLADQPETLGISVIFDAMLHMFGLMWGQGGGGMSVEALLNHW